VTVCACRAYQHLFCAAGKFCENQPKARSLSAVVRHAYRQSGIFLFPEKSQTVTVNLLNNCNKEIE